MQIIEILAIIFSVAIVGGVIALSVIKKKSGKGGCSGCSGNCASCKSAKKVEEKKDQA